MRPDDRTTARLWSRAVASAAVVESAGCTNGSGVGTCDETTMRALDPTSRASRYEPSTVSVRTSRSDLGLETSISDSTDLAG